MHHPIGHEAAKMDDWERGLPSADDLTPLSQSLIPPELASAFKISPEAPRTMLDVNRASQTTFSSLRSSAPIFKPSDDDHMMEEPEPFEEGGASDPKRIRESEEEAIDNCAKEKGKAAKRARLVWTPQLHKRFVEVVAHLGLKNAVPKTIMHLMNVEGLSRENVASHLQKYRLYVKRMQGLSDDDPSDQLFASTPLPPSQSLNESSRSQGYGNSYGNHTNGNNSYNNNSGGNGNSHGGMQMPVLPMAMMGMGQGKVNSAGFHGYEEAGNSQHHHHHHYQQQYHSNVMQHQRDWSGNTYSTHMTQSNK